MFWFLWWHYIPFCSAFLGIPTFCWWISFRCFPTSALFCFQLLLGSSFWPFPLFFCLCYFSFHFLNTLLYDLLPWIPLGFNWFFPSRCCFRAVSFFSCDQAAIWLVQSVRPSVRPSVCLSVCHTFFTVFPSSYHHEIFRGYYHGQRWCLCKRSRSEVKGQGHRGQHPT